MAFEVLCRYFVPQQVRSAALGHSREHVDYVVCLPDGLDARFWQNAAVPHFTLRFPLAGVLHPSDWL